jgi:hypothetical protein
MRRLEGLGRAMHKGNDFIRSITNEREAIRIDILDGQGDVIGFLSPITKSVLSNEKIIERMTKWRNAARKYFLTQFTANCARTRDWLENIVLKDDTRLLFLIHSGGKHVGQHGFKGLSTHSAELDNLVRGEMGGHPRLVYYAEAALVNWVFEIFNIEIISAFVLSNNFLARKLHESFGFKVTERIPLYERKLGDEICLRKDISECVKVAGFYGQKMMLTRSDFTDFWKEMHAG